MCSHDRNEEFKSLYAGLYPSLWRSLSFVLKDEHLAEDALQEAFLRALQRWDRLSDRENLKRWLFLVALRYALRHRNRTVAAVHTARDTLLQVVAAASRHIQDPVAEAIERRALSQQVRQALRRIPRRYRKMLTLFYFDDRNLKEVAHLLKISPSAAKVGLYRARRLLRTVCDQLFQR